MKISSCIPEYVTPNAKISIGIYESLGYEVKHHPNRWEYILEASDGNRMVLIENKELYKKAGNTFYGLRVNVDNIEEGVKYYEDQGFKKESFTFNTESAKLTRLVKDDIIINLVEHIKRDK